MRLSTPTGVPVLVPSWPLDFGPYSSVLTEYADWIIVENRHAADDWAVRLNKEPRDPTNAVEVLEKLADVEGAVAEALAWAFLRRRVARIEPVDDSSSTKTPDFHCVVDGVGFFVEVTNMSRAKGTECWGKEEVEKVTSGGFGTWPKAVKRQISNRASKGGGLQEPFLVMVATLHRGLTWFIQRPFAVEQVLHSTSKIQGFIDTEGEPVGSPKSVVDFQDAAFTGKSSLSPERRHVAGALLVGFGGYFGAHNEDPAVAGILHPEARRPFDPQLLPSVPFVGFREKSWPPSPGDELDLEWRLGGATFGPHT